MSPMTSLGRARWEAPGFLGPGNDIGLCPDPADRQLRGRLRELVGAGELVDALAGDAEQLGDLDRAHQIHRPTVALAPGQGQSVRSCLQANQSGPGGAGTPRDLATTEETRRDDC